MRFRDGLLALFSAALLQVLAIDLVIAKDAMSTNEAPIEVEFVTTKGLITLQLYPEKAPLTVANFLQYVDEGFYGNTVFHRAIPGFVIQGGGFEPGLKPKAKTRKPIKNESANGMRNLRGMISMARRTHPDTATSQFYINLSDNSNLDYKSSYQPGYAVFGKVVNGMEVIDAIASIPTKTVGRMTDVPVEEVAILSVKRKGSPLARHGSGAAKSGEEAEGSFVAGEHYAVLERPVPTRDNAKVEVVEMFSYGCPHCYEFDSPLKRWSDQQGADVDFWHFPAVWNESMALYARAFYVAQQLGVAEQMHQTLFTALVLEHKNIHDEAGLAELFVEHKVNRESFLEAFRSEAVALKVKHAEERVRLYKPVGVPEIIVNGKYRVDRMRAGGLMEMLAVVDYLVDKERASLKP